MNSVVDCFSIKDANGPTLISVQILMYIHVVHITGQFMREIILKMRD